MLCPDLITCRGIKQKLGAGPRCFLPNIHQQRWGGAGGQPAAVFTFQLLLNLTSASCWTFSFLLVLLYQQEGYLTTLREWESWDPLIPSPDLILEDCKQESELLPLGWMVLPKSELGFLHTDPIRTALGPLPMIRVITCKFYGFNMHWPSDIMTSGHSNMLRKWKDWNTNCKKWVVFRRSVIERVVWMKRLVL